MRLYLSSFRLGADPSHFVRLAGGQKVGLVVNALDNRLQAREAWGDRQAKELSTLGFSVREVDLRSYFGDPRGLAIELAALDAIWINGGNAFVLRRAMRASGFDILIKDMLRDDRIAYGGFSAASVILAVSLRGLELVDDPDDVPDGYCPETIWEGLGILPFSVVVHYRSDHAESDGAEREVRFYERNRLPYRTLRDGEAFVIEGHLDTLNIVGAPTA